MSFLIAALLSLTPQATAQTHISKTTVSELIEGQPTRLDWKTSEIVIPFNLPETVWVDKVEFLISARPTGALRHHRNLQLRVNGSEPIILKAQGQRFDARIKLDQQHLRRHGNKLYISSQSTSSTCIGPDHAGWDISTDRSFLVYYGRPMKRDLNLKDLASIWSHPSTKPSLVGLKVIGDDKFRHESLIMQGLSIRTNSVPKIRSTFNNNHIDIVAGLREDIKPYIRNTNHRKANGAEIILDKGHPMRLIITGDTADQVTDAINAFSTHKLPLTRRVKTTPTELRLQPVLSNERPIFEKTHRLAEAGSIIFTDSWATPPLNFNFDVPNSTDKTGEITLRLTGNKALSKSSTLQVSLNDRKLGVTKIDARRKTVKFDITYGLLATSNNKLEITSDLHPAKNIDNCSIIDTQPGFSLGLGSKIVLEGQVDKKVHNVASLAVRTGPFATAKNVVIYSTAQRTRDRNSLLRLTGNIALISGKAWTHATYIEGRNPLIPTTDNLLILGPVTNNVEDLLTTAPKALKLALKGQKLPSIDEQLVAGIFKVASSEGTEAIRLAAAAERSNARSGFTGLMSLYDDPVNQRTVGIISTKPGSSFSQAATNLLKPGIWNNIAGSVAAWNSNTSVVAQAPQRKLLSDSPPHELLSLGQNPLTSINWDRLDIAHDDMVLAISHIWQDQARSLNDTLSSWSTTTNRWFHSLNKPKNVKPELIKDIGETIPPQTERKLVASKIPTPIVKPENSFKANKLAVQNEASLSLLELRGTSKDELPGLSFASGITPQISMKALNNSLSKSWNTIQTKVHKTHNDFAAWGKSINQTRVSKGQKPIIPSPLLTLILIVFGGLILLTVAGPKQLRYRGQV
ncbi:MAG: cellulose biosynthesis cyclic di-GMP-binding regulatory protein BcsB [Maricaulaceae bacterium]